MVPYTFLCFTRSWWAHIGRQITSVADDDQIDDIMQKRMHMWLGLSSSFRPCEFMTLLVSLAVPFTWSLASLYSKFRHEYVISDAVRIMVDKMCYVAVFGGSLSSRPKGSSIDSSSVAPGAREKFAEACRQGHAGHLWSQRWWWWSRLIIQLSVDLLLTEMRRHLHKSHQIQPKTYTSRPIWPFVSIQANPFMFYWSVLVCYCHSLYMFGCISIWQCWSVWEALILQVCIQYWLVVFNTDQYFQIGRASCRERVCQYV